MYQLFDSRPQQTLPEKIWNINWGLVLLLLVGVQLWYGAVVLVLAAAVTVLVAVLFSPAEPVLARYFEATWHSFTYWLTGKL